MSASLMDIWIEPNQCPLHQSILLTQGPIHKILAEIAQFLANFYYYDGLQPEMRVGIVNEHECTSTG